MTHLTSSELQDWHDGRIDRDRARVVSHLAECPECAARLASVARSSDDSVEPATGDLEPFLAAGRRAGAQVLGAGSLPGFDMRWLALAAALVIAVGGTFYFMKREAPNVMRGGGAAGVVLQSPVGDVAAGTSLRFVWTGTTGPARLRVVDLDGPADAIVDATVQTGVLEIPEAVRGRFVRGHAYRWFVEYTDGSGASRSTPAAGFVIR